MAKFKTSIGGQALIEGVYMRGPEQSAMAVRLPDDSIDVETFPTANPKAWYKKTPFIRGGFNMIDSLMQGYKCLMKSAEKSGMESGEPGEFEKWLANKLGKSLTTVVSAFALVLGIAIAIGLFMVLPAFVVGLFNHSDSQVSKTLIEGLVKIMIFVLYVAVIGQLGEIKRVFQYHGAEHKTIFCYESGEDLTVENVRAKSRFHPRCGTSFLLIVLVISILLFSVVTWNSILLRVVLKLAMLPVVIGIAYEIVKIAGRYDNIVTRVISAPGLWMQRLTTAEPDDSQIEVAIASINPTMPKEKGADEW